MVCIAFNRPHQLFVPKISIFFRLYLRCLIFIWGFFVVGDIFSRYLRCNADSNFSIGCFLLPLYTYFNGIKRFSFIFDRIFLHICMYAQRNGGKLVNKNVKKRNVTENYCQNLSFWWLCVHSSFPYRVCCFVVSVCIHMRMHISIITLSNSHYHWIIFGLIRNKHTQITIFNGKSHLFASMTI